VDQYVQIVVGFLLTGLIGNWLLHKWQARTWLLQQRFLGKEKEYVALKELTDELASLLGIRIFRMRRLNWLVASGTVADIADRLREYDEALQRWNEKLASFYIRLPMLADYQFAWQLEHLIQADLVSIGGEIEGLVKKRKASVPVLKGEPFKIEVELNKLQGKVIALTKRLLHEVKERRVDVYYGKKVLFSAANLRYFSTWQLVKALFVRDVDSLAVIRASLDS
jgi:hypothetical protein